MKKNSLAQSVCLLIGILAILGFGLAQTVSVLELDDKYHSRSDNIFYHLFTTYDQWHLIFVAALSGFFFWWLGKPQTKEISLVPTLSKKNLWLIAFGVTAICAIGTHLVFLNYPFAMDEFYSDFQAEIFASGKIFAPIPTELTPLAAAAAPLMVNYDAASQTWTSNYLPVYALLRTPFWIAGCSWLVNPLCAGLSLVALAGVIRRLWPTDSSLPWVGVLLLASNAQFLITGMTAYAMSAHLLANLFWLWLYLHPSPKAQALAPLLGVLAVGLHQPNVHLVFALPFCIKLLWDRRWKMAAWYAAIYASGFWGWLRFMDYKSSAVALKVTTSNANNITEIIGKIFNGIPAPIQWINFVVDLEKQLAWTSFALVFFLFVAIYFFRKLSSISLCLLAGVAISLAITFMLKLNQGHGWGNRYLFPYLGNLILLAVAGFHQLSSNEWGKRIVLWSSAASLFLAFPLRAWEAHREVTPFARASAYIHALPQQMIAIDSAGIWYGQDLIRNSPSLTNTPKVIFLRRFSEEVKDYGEEHKPNGLIGIKQLEKLGMTARFVPSPKENKVPASP